MEKLTYNVTEAAKVLGVSRPTMYTMIHRADFPAFRAGNRILISRQGLAEWVEAQAGGTKETAPGGANSESGKGVEQVLHSPVSASYHKPN